MTQLAGLLTWEITFAGTFFLAYGLNYGSSSIKSQNVKYVREAFIKKQALRSSCELLRTKDSKDSKRNKQEPLGTFSLQ